MFLLCKKIHVFVMTIKSKIEHPSIKRDYFNLPKEITTYCNTLSVYVWRFYYAILLQVFMLICVYHDYKHGLYKHIGGVSVVDFMISYVLSKKVS